MPDSITIPRSIAAAERKLNELGEIATATEWSRAAIVATWTKPGSGGRRQPSSSGQLSYREFSELGIVGLRSTTTVQLYAEAWTDAHDGERPQPGRRVTLPDAGWPPTRTGTDGYQSAEGMQRTVARLIERHGAEPVAEAIAEAAPRMTRDAATRAIAATLPTPPFDTPPSRSPTPRRRHGGWTWIVTSPVCGTTPVGSPTTAGRIPT